MRRGDCKSYSIAKYAAVRVAGISPDHVRLVIVHNKRDNEDHMVAAVYQDKQWLILDNLTMLVLPDVQKRDYEPTAVLDYTGVRRYLSAFWMDKGRNANRPEAGLTSRSLTQLTWSRPFGS